MAIIGFNFSKLSCERKNSVAKGNIEIKHNITINSVEKSDLNVGSSKTDVLRIKFSFDVIYGSDLGSINIAGDLMYSDNKEIIEETVKGFKSDKKLNQTVGNEVHKFIYSKSIIKALELSDNTNLPAPIPVVPPGLKKSN